MGGDPCLNETALDVPFRQPFDNRLTTLRQDAAEVRCQAGTLRGAHLSDHGKVILTLWFDQDADGRPLIREHMASSDKALATDEQPGRIGYALNGDGYQDEREFVSMCRHRAQNGYNSGMGEIFRKVAAITPLETDMRQLLPAAQRMQSHQDKGRLVVGGVTDGLGVFSLDVCWLLDVLGGQFLRGTYVQLYELVRTYSTVQYS